MDTDPDPVGNLITDPPSGSVMRPAIPWCVEWLWGKTSDWPLLFLDMLTGCEMRLLTDCCYSWVCFDWLWVETPYWPVLFLDVLTGSTSDLLLLFLDVLTSRLSGETPHWLDMLSGCEVRLLTDRWYSWICWLADFFMPDYCWPCLDVIRRLAYYCLTVPRRLYFPALQ